LRQVRGIAFAELFSGATLRLSLKRTKPEGGLEGQMRNVLTLLMAAIFAMLLSVASFAQKNGDDKRPPKNNPPIVERPKSPPPNSNRGNQNNNKHGKP